MGIDISEELKNRLLYVADRLGEDLCTRIAFVGGCVTGLLVTDPIVRRGIRMTEDVDLIVDVLTWARYERLKEELRSRGFREAMDEDVVCRWRLDGLVVDVMPIDEKILKFSNRWYQGALENAEEVALTPSESVKVVSAPYFVGTKIEAFRGRGNDDFLGSRDIEDIFTLVDGRPSLVPEIEKEQPTLRTFISENFANFMRNQDFEITLQSTTAGDMERARLLYERIETIARL